MSLVDRPAVSDSDRTVAGRLLEDYGRDRRRGRALRAHLAEQFPRCPREEIEDAVQTARRCFLDEADGITEPSSAYAWIRTAAYRTMIHELRAQVRSVALDPTEGEIGGAVVDDRAGARRATQVLAELFQAIWQKDGQIVAVKPQPSMAPYFTAIRDAQEADSKAQKAIRVVR